MYIVKLTVFGEVTYVLRNKTGEIIGTQNSNNLVVTTGRYHIADQLASFQDETAMGYMAIGGNNTAPAAGDTALYSELGRVALSGRTQGTGSNANQVTYAATFPAGTGTGTIVEAGILNAAAAGIMLSRSTFSAITKTAADTLDVSWVLTISAV